jgi:hypothetical protein
VVNHNAGDLVAVAVLPAGIMRRFTWSGPAPALDPLARWVCADVLTTGDLTVSGMIVPGEGSRARAGSSGCYWRGPIPAGSTARK